MRLGPAFFGLLSVACVFEAPPATSPEAPPATSPEAPPAVETSFGDDGLVIIDDLIAGTQSARALAILPEGGVAVSVVLADVAEVDSAIVRLSSAGERLGTSIYRTDGDDYFEAVAADDEGAIYAVGATVFSDVRALIPVVKYRADGEPDTTFGTGGQMQLPSLFETCTEARSYQVAFGASIDREMRLLISGNATEADCTDRDMIVARIDAGTGVLDPSFGTGGVVTAGVPGFTGAQSDNGQDVIALRDGRIAVVGNTNRTGDFDTARAALWIRDIDGAEQMAAGFGDLDRSGSGSDSFHAVASDSAGRLIAAGRSFNGTDYDAVVMRFHPSGEIDESFGGGVLVFSTRGEDRARAIAVDTTDRIWIAGYSGDGEQEDSLVWRLLPDGAPDPTWGQEGLMIHDAELDVRAEALAVDAQDRVFVAGTIRRSDGTSAVLVRRLSP